MSEFTVSSLRRAEARHDEAPDLRCARQTEGLGESPGGTAGSAARYLLVELPLPWPKPIAAHPLLTSLAAEVPLVCPRWRVQAVVGPESQRGHHRIVTYDRDPLSSPRYVGSEIAVTTDELVDALRHAMTETPSGRPVAGDTIDVAICTQGTHDRCCGSFGTELYLDLVAQAEPGLRIWRTSHTGGHRFAPTAISLPDGHMWAGVTAELVQSLSDGTVEPATAALHLRGAMGLSSSAAQVADAAVFAERGWGWLHGGRHVSETTDEVTGEVNVTLVAAGDSPVADVRLRPGDPMPVPACGEPLERAKKTTTGYEVQSIRWHSTDLA